MRLSQWLKEVRGVGAIEKRGMVKWMDGYLDRGTYFLDGKKDVRMSTKF